MLAWLHVFVVPSPPAPAAADKTSAPMSSIVSSAMGHLFAVLKKPPMKRSVAG
jgi:hypothetical protein